MANLFYSNYNEDRFCEGIKIAGEALLIMAKAYAKSKEGETK